MHALYKAPSAGSSPDPEALCALYIIYIISPRADCPSGIFKHFDLFLTQSDSATCANPTQSDQRD